MPRRGTAPPLLARFQGTALAARVSGVWESLRSLAATDPLLVPLYCAPLCALKVLWRALGLSHSNAGLALRHFHRSVIDVSMAREQHHTALIQVWFSSRSLRWGLDAGAVFTGTHDIHPSVRCVGILSL